jgi:hypothetical protein
MSFEPVIYVQETRNAPTKKVLKSIKSFLAANQPTQEFQNSVVPKLSNVSEEILVNLKQIASAIETDTIEYSGSLSNASVGISDSAAKKRKHRENKSLISTSGAVSIKQPVEESAVDDDDVVLPVEAGAVKKRKHRGSSNLTNENDIDNILEAVDESATVQLDSETKSKKKSKKKNKDH